MGLFGKPEEKKPSEPAPAGPSAPTVKPAPAALTVIGRQAVIEGEIRSTEDITIEGRVEGHIRCDGTLTIGESGQVKAEIKAKLVSVRGKFEGNCHSTQRVEITRTGHVQGKVSAPAIVVAEGAVFLGSSEMSPKEKEKEREKPKEAQPAQKNVDPAGATSSSLNT